MESPLCDYGKSDWISSDLRVIVVYLFSFSCASVLFNSAKCCDWWLQQGPVLAVTMFNSENFSGHFNQEISELV